MYGRMFLKTYLDVPVSVDSFKATFSWEPERCFGGLGERTREEGERLLAEAGLAGFNVRRAPSGPDRETSPGRARLQLGGVLVHENLVSVPFELRIEGPGGFPSLIGTIDAAWLGPERAYLSLSLQYDIASHLLDRTVERTVYNRVVEVVMQHFLANVVNCLCVSCGKVVPSAAGATPSAASHGSIG